MANLKEIRVRISSVKSTRQITSAMKMVSAAKLRKAQDYIMQLRPYADKLMEILESLSSSIGVDDNPYAVKREVNRVLCVVVTSNRGLCGGFNSVVAKKVMADLQGKYHSLLLNDNVDLYAIGKKGGDLLKGKGYKLLKVETDIYDNLNYENALPIVEAIMHSFTDKVYDEVVIYYNEFINAATQEVKATQFLPIEQPKPDDNSKTVNTDYIFEPNKKEIINDLIPTSLKTNFFRIILDSNASEHGARMTSMHKATDNASEMIKDLTLDYNKARQAAITNEILEIVGGAEALKG